MTRKWITFLRSTFSFIFQKIQQTSRVTVFFLYKKRLKKWRKLHVLSCSEEHSYTEIRLSNGCPKSCKITPKCIENHRKMNTKKCGFRCCNGQKRTSSLHLQKYMKTRSFLYFPVLLCLHHGRKNRSKSSKIDHKMITKKCDSRSCNGQKRTPSNDLRKCIKTRPFLPFPMLLCSRHGYKNRFKSLKIIDGGMHGVYGRARREAGQFEVYSM